jgi:dimethylglycine dehydrogenase
MTILVVAGPKSRDVLSRVAPRTDWSAQAFPWLSARRVFLGPIEAIALSVSFSGELAWELHIPNSGLLLAHELLTEAGESLGLGRFGNLAVESMRLEKGYRHWKADLITEFDPFESALDRFVDLSKPAFPGKAALERRIAEGPRRRFVSLVLDDRDAPAHPGDSLMQGGRVVGTVTSGGWGHRVGENLAMAFVDPGLAEQGATMEALVLGRRVSSRVVAPCRYDPENARVKG